MKLQIGGAMHYHVTINGETLSWAHIAVELAEAMQIEADTRASQYRLASDVVVVVECLDTDCGDYQDFVSFVAGARALLDDDVLSLEHARMVIESDGHGPA